jgi:hypothetical protein
MEEGAEEVPDEEGDGRLMTCPRILCCSISAILPRYRPSMGTAVHAHCGLLGLSSQAQQFQ